MPITPLPQFEADLAEHLAEQADREAYERLTAPKTLVVRFGFMKMVGEFPWRSDSKPGCGSKIVVRTSRGIEIGEMLTSTCPNSGCSKSVSRKEMLEYIENSGGKDYPFYTDGEALRIASKEDLDKQAAIEAGKRDLVREARALVERLGIRDMKIVEAEPLLGGERVTFYYFSEDRVDFRSLLQELRAKVGTKIDLRQVGARDEARLTADYERCGQYCCCKNFLKVLKPISMRSAKVQKATLDPLKISGRCGRLMCCLRYEDETYEELRKRLPNRKKLVGTPEGNGIVIESQILTQLVLVELDATRQRVAIPVEDLTEPQEAPARSKSGGDRGRGRRDDRPDEHRDSGGDGAAKKKRRRRKKKKSADAGDSTEQAAASPGPKASSPSEAAGETGTSSPTTKKKRRRRRRKGTGDQGASRTSGSPEKDRSADASSGGSAGSKTRPESGSGSAGGASGDGDDGSGGNSGTSGGGSKKKRRRRRRKNAGGGSGSEGGVDGGSGSGSDPGSGGGDSG